MELLIKKCAKCGSVVQVLHDCDCVGDCGIKCCGENLITVKANTTDGAVEKHVPEYVINDGFVEVVVNHVMEEDHYIEWIAAVYDKKICTKYLNPGEDAKAKFKYKEGMVLYAYCNKHLLWKKEVK